MEFDTPAKWQASAVQLTGLWKQVVKRGLEAKVRAHLSAATQTAIENPWSTRWHSGDVLSDLSCGIVDELAVAAEDGPIGDHKIVVAATGTWSQGPGAEPAAADEAVPTGPLADRASRSRALRSRSVGSRPSRNSRWPRSERRRASARPMPLVAPRNTTFMACLRRGGWTGRCG